MTAVRPGSLHPEDGPPTEESAVGGPSGDLRPMRADAVRNHEKILRAAEEVFAADGVMVPIDVVAERAGVGVGTLYRHFPTKESLYEAIVTTRVTRLLATADEFVDDPDPAEALDHFMRAFARQVADKQDLFEALGQSGIDFKTHFAEPLRELMDRIDVLLRRAIDAGVIRGDVEVDDILRLVMGTCHAAGHGAGHGARHDGADDAGLQRLVSIVLAGLRPVVGQ